MASRSWAHVRRDWIESGPRDDDLGRGVATVFTVINFIVMLRSYRCFEQLFSVQRIDRSVKISEFLVPPNNNFSHTRQNFTHMPQFVPPQSPGVRNERFLHSADKLWDSRELIDKKHHRYSTWGRKDLENQRLSHEKKCRKLDHMDELDKAAQMQERRQMQLHRLQQKREARTKFEENVGMPFRHQRVEERQRTVFVHGRHFRGPRRPDGSPPRARPVPVPDRPSLTRTGLTSAGDRQLLDYTASARGLLTGGAGNRTPPRLVTGGQGGDTVEVKDWKYYANSQVPIWDRKEYIPPTTQRILERSTAKGEAYLARLTQTAQIEDLHRARDLAEFQRARREDIRQRLTKRRLDRIELSATCAQPVSAHDLHTVDTIVEQYGQPVAPPSPAPVPAFLPALPHRLSTGTQRHIARAMANGVAGTAPHLDLVLESQAPFRTDGPLVRGRPGRLRAPRVTTTASALDESDRVVSASIARFEKKFVRPKTGA